MDNLQHGDNKGAEKCQYKLMQAFLIIEAIFHSPLSMSIADHIKRSFLKCAKLSRTAPLS